MIRTFLVITAAVVALAGCAGQTVTTTKTTDPATLIETTTTTTQEKDFFESGNLRMYYEAEGKRVEAYSRLADKKISVIQQQGIERQKYLTTPTEQALSNIMDTLLVAQISTSAPQATAPPPKTMTDWASSGAGIQWARLGLDVAGEVFGFDVDFGSLGGNSDGSASLKEVTVAGNLLINSEINDQHYLEEGSAWSESYSPSLSWETYTGNSQNTGQEGQATSSTSTDEEVGILQ